MRLLRPSQRAGAIRRLRSPVPAVRRRRHLLLLDLRPRCPLCGGVGAQTPAMLRMSFMDRQDRLRRTCNPS